MDYEILYLYITSDKLTATTSLEEAKLLPENIDGTKGAGSCIYTLESYPSNDEIIDIARDIGVRRGFCQVTICKISPVILEGSVV